MDKPTVRNLARLALVTALSLAGSRLATASDVSLEEIVARHLDSIGTAQARAAIKNRVAEGTVHFRTLVGGAGQMDGKAVLLSEQRKVHLLLKFDNVQYGGERFVFDGDKTQVSANTSGKVRSSFGQLIYNQEGLLREGLLGGTLSTAWPFLSLSDHNPKLAFRGKKKVNGRELYDVDYRPKKAGDMEIHVYFDPETFRHVMTVYTLDIEATLSRGTTFQGGTTESQDEVQSRQQQTRYRIEERFSDFQTADGITLPTHYDIHFARELQSGDTSEFDWTVVLQQIHSNLNLEPRNFEVK